MKTAGIIGGVVVAIFAVAYFTSDVFSTKVDQAAEQWAKWTPENIRKDPAGYLAFAKAQLEIADGKLKDRQLSLKKKQTEYTRKHKEAEIQKAKWEKLLGDLRSKYSEVRNLSSGNSTSPSPFPIRMNGRDIKDEETLKRLAVESNRELNYQTKLESSYSVFAQKITAQLTKCEDQIRNMADKRRELDLQTEIVLMKLTIEDMEKDVEGIKSIFDATVALAGEPDNVTAKDLLDASNVTKTDTEFAELGW